MVNRKEEYEEFTSCVCLKIRAACIFVGFFNVVGLIMRVMVISVELLLHLLISFWVAENSKLIEIKIRNSLICYYNYRNHAGNCLQFLSPPMPTMSF